MNKLHVHVALTLCSTFSVLQLGSAGLATPLAMAVAAAWMASASARWRTTLPTITMGRFALENSCMEGGGWDKRMEIGRNGERGRGGGGGGGKEVGTEVGRKGERDRGAEKRDEEDEEEERR